MSLHWSRCHIVETHMLLLIYIIQMPISSKSDKYIPNKKRNAPLRTVQLLGRPQVIDQFGLYQCKGMSGTAALHIFCNLASKLC